MNTMRAVYILLFAFLILGKSKLYAQLQDANYIQLTQINYETGDIDEAFRLLDILEKKYPNNGYILTEKGAWQLYGENDINSALISLSQAAKMNTNDDNLLTLRGIAFYRKGLIDKAIEDQKAAISINPKPVVFYIKLGNYQFALNKYDEAGATFLKGIEINPSEAEIYGDAFAVYAVLNQPQEAKLLFEKGLLQNNMDIGFLRCYYGNFLMRIQQFDAASKQYQMVYNMPEPHMYAADYHDAAISYFKIGEFQKAIFFIDIAISKAPQQINYLTNKADIAMNLKDWDLVMSTSQKAIELDPKNALAHMYMSIGLKWGPGNIEESERYQLKSKELNENNN